MKNDTASCLIALALALAGGADAATVVNVSLGANGSSRWFEYFSDAFAQVDRGFGGNPSLDGFFLISSELNPDNPSVFAPIGSGADVFPSEGNWNNVGTFTLSGTVTGMGVESFTIQSAAFNFGQYIADNEGLVGSYATAIASISSGTIQLTDGLVTDLNFVGNIVFTYDFTAFGAGPLPFAGDLMISESGFDLDVDAAYTFFNPNDLRYRWDAAGTSSFEVVPEPSALLLFAAGLGGFALRRRR